jgi:hypothetical protein
MAERNKDKPLPQLVSIPDVVSIPDELREFLEVVDLLTEKLESGVYRLEKEEDSIVWDEVTWSNGTRSIFGPPGVVCFPDENLAEFEFRYAYYGATEWEFELTREELAKIASGTVADLALYGCANPVCAREQERCPRCHLTAWMEINQSPSQRVLGICPYCNQPLRTLYAQQCRHCQMDWHDPDHPTKLGAKS